ncbi:MAG TPA: CapA family protein [Firmicutes bacterium]|nr:CapA family protein [Bacillota bacterium]
MKRTAALILIGVIALSGWGLCFFRGGFGRGHEVVLSFLPETTIQAERAREYISTHLPRISLKLVSGSTEEADFAIVPSEAASKEPELPGLKVKLREKPSSPVKVSVLDLSGQRRILRRALDIVTGRQRAISAVARTLGGEQCEEAINESAREVVIRVVGDLMFARGTAKAMAEKGTLYPVEKVAPVLASADIAIANLESPVGVSGEPIPGKLIWFRAPPASMEAIKYAGIDAVTLANNHILDYDTPLLKETISLLDAAGIVHAGAGANISEARRPAIVERKGLRIALLGCSEFANPNLFWSRSYPRTFLATEDQAGTAPIQDQMIKDDIARARKLADIVLVAFHWGQEYVNYPQSYFGRDLREIARVAIDAGADAVLGFHPHAIQGIEIYKGKPIAYSLGNFVMDQKRPVTRESMILELHADKNGIKWLKVIPVMITDCQPCVLDGEEGQALLQKIQRISPQPLPTE